MQVDPREVPVEPVYTIMVTASGVSIDGEPIDAPVGDPGAARRAALAEIRVRAALRGRPVRVTAKEPDGMSWPLIVDGQGNLTTLSAPHPEPPRSEPRFIEPAAPASPPPSPQPAPASPPPPTEWGAPFPEAYQDAWSQVQAAHTGRDFSAAAAMAEKVETALEFEFGPLHPHTVIALSARAWLTLHQRGDWFSTVELLIHAALRRGEVGAEPRTETTELLRNTHAAWQTLAKEDPEGAVELSGAMAEMFGKFGWESHAQDVMGWVDKAMGGGEPGMDA